MSVWQACQARWLQLHPVCAVPETEAQLPADARRQWASVSSTWRELMAGVARPPRLTAKLAALTADGNLLPTLRDCCRSLELVCSKQ